MGEFPSPCFKSQQVEWGGSGLPFTPMSSENTAPRADGARRPNRRRRKFVRKDLQLKIIFGTLFVALIVLVINFQLPIMGMWIMRATSTIWLDTHYNLMIKLLVTSFATSFLLTIPLAIWMGIVFSFQFCGPIYKIKKFFVELNSGRWDRICRLRKNDDLKDVAEVINQYVSLARDRLRSQHETLEKVRTFLETCDQSEQVESLLALIQEEGSEYAPRLGVEAPAVPEVAVASAAETESQSPAETEAAVSSDDAQGASVDDSSKEDAPSDESDVKDASGDTESSTEEETVKA